MRIPDRRSRATSRVADHRVTRRVTDPTGSRRRAVTDPRGCFRWAGSPWDRFGDATSPTAPRRERTDADPTSRTRRRSGAAEGLRGRSRSLIPLGPLRVTRDAFAAAADARRSRAFAITPDVRAAGPIGAVSEPLGPLHITRDASGNVRPPASSMGWRSLSQATDRGRSGIGETGQADGAIRGPAGATAFHSPTGFNLRPPSAMPRRKT